MTGKKNLTLEARLLQYVVKSDGCWLWTGQRRSSGYGRIKVLGQSVNVHRVAYEIWVGEIPDGMCVDHICFVRNCVNPAHLRVLSTRENASLKRSLSATHCKNGHPRTESNRLNPQKNDYRAFRCRLCAYAANRKYKAKLRERRLSG